MSDANSSPAAAPANQDGAAAIAAAAATGGSVTLDGNDPPTEPPIGRLAKFALKIAKSTEAVEIETLLLAQELEREKAKLAEVKDDGRRPVEGDLLASLKSELKSELKAEMETGMSALREELKEVRDEKATLASDLISVRTKADRLEAEIEELRVALAASTTADADAHGE